MGDQALRHILSILSIVLVFVGLRLLRDPDRARRGNALAAAGVLLAIAAAWIVDRRIDIGWGLGGIALGAAAGAWVAVRVRMTQMPQLVALLNGSGGLASAIVGLVWYLEGVSAGARGLGDDMLAIVVGAATFTGSAVAAAKLQGWIGPPMRGRILERTLMGLATALVAIAVGAALLRPGSVALAWIGFGAAGAWGILFAIPIGGADMPIAISLLNALSGLAASLAGFVVGNPVLIVLGAIVGASGTILTRAMGKAMNRSLLAVLAGPGGGRPVSPARRPVQAAPSDDVPPIDRAVAALTRARTVMIIPGYGMAVAQAQGQVKALADLLEQAGKEVSFGIHPVAGRMPGHMNVLLAEVDVPYEKLLDLEAANLALPKIDAAVIVGACDVVNPAARDARGTPLYGMPVLEVGDWADDCIVCNLDRSPGYSGVENTLYPMEKTVFIEGDAKQTVAELTRRLR
ncbi:MAG: NAD(P)(+) transhydrogenase (Re/Si-specific) subunit beta [Planctomycetes bacterium]|nr:NAD(P)(+) transhydrogenase (Re/Si-specific) subunit beta [Planctomycetota bacterium]